MKSLTNPHVPNSSLVPGIVWRKSTRSPNNGGSCVEAGVWRKSTRSASDAGQCVEVAMATDQVALRDSKHPTGPLLSVANTQWLCFLENIKHDDLS